MRSKRVAIATGAMMAVALPVLIGTSAGQAVRPPSTVQARAKPPQRGGYLANDSHLHLTNYIQEGPELASIVKVMGDKVGRAALFGIPLQQEWSYRLSGNDAPSYYLDADSDLYYYSFTDAYIAMSYRRLPKAMQARFDPMITGFNPADMYAADHVRRVLQTFPGVFVGIGEFSIHKEFVTSKVAGDAPSLSDPALDRLFDFAGQAGLVVLVHCDADTPFPKPGAPPAYFAAMLDKFRAHPNTTFIWAHIGLGRVIRPFTDMRALIEKMLDDPTLKHVHFDLSWSETAKYLSSAPDTVDAVAAALQRHPDRFLFGTDEVGPTNQEDYLRVLRMYQPLWDKLPGDVLEAVRKRNYERIFDRARSKVRAWEAAHGSPAAQRTDSRVTPP
jgi:predicted TIM-barrel fold metal-dependent hydrolase